MIWFREIWRSKLKFGMLAIAVGLLFFLLLFVNTVSSTLLDRFVGAVENSSADLLVFQSDAQATIQASRLTPEDVSRVGEVDDVLTAAPISALSTDALVGGDETNVSLWGVEIGGPGTPTRLIEGRLPEPGEAVVDTTARDAGMGVGTSFDVSGVQMEVVGVAEKATYAVLATAYVPYETWMEVFAAQFPEAPGAPVNMVGVEVADDAEVDVVAAAVSDLDGLEALSPADAASATPGAASIGQSFALITGITFAIVIVVVGFFFLILTVQKLRVFALLEAIGTRAGSLAGYVFSQIGALVAAGVAIGAGMLAIAAVATREIFSISVDPVLTAVLGGAVLLASLACGAFSVRRILKQDAALVATGSTR